MPYSDNALAAAGAVWAVLSAGHWLADYCFGQTDHQADHKAAPTADEVKAGANPRRGWGACLGHVALYHLVLSSLYLLVRLALPLPTSPLGLTAALLWSASTHAVLDRRWLVRLILERTGSPGFSRLEAGGVSGPHLADQALHKGALLVAVVLIVRL